MDADREEGKNGSKEVKPKSPSSSGDGPRAGGDGGEGRGKDGPGDDAPKSGLAAIASDAREDALSAADASAKVCAEGGGAGFCLCMCVRVCA